MPCTSFAEPSTIRGKCDQKWTPYTPCHGGGESDFGADGHSYLTRAFFIAFIGEEVDLNEVVQFQLDVNLPSNITPSSIMHCKLHMNLLHEKKSAAAAAQGEGTVPEGERSLNLDIVSSVVYSLRIPAEGIHEMIPITFSLPYFVCLDGMIHCALLNFKPFDEVKYVKDLGKESRSTTLSPSSKSKDCNQEVVDESGGMFNMVHIEMVVKSLNSIVSAFQWLLSLEPILQRKEEVFIRELQQFYDFDMGQILILLKNINSDVKFSSLIHYLEKGGISSLIKRNSSITDFSREPLPSLETQCELEEEDDPFCCLSPIEDIDMNISLIFQFCFVNWNLFFHLLPSRHEMVVENLRREWLYQCRQTSTSISLQHTSIVPPNLMCDDESFSTVLECDLELNTEKLWIKLRRELNNVKGDGRKRLRNVVRIPDLGCSPMFLCQRYISVQNSNLNMSPKFISTSISLDGIERSCSLGTFFRSFRNPPPRPHLIVLQHGFRGKAYDMHLLSNSIRIFVPDAYVFCPKANENKPDASLNEMGSNLADEVVDYIERHCPIIAGGYGGLSFVGFSAGSLVIRCMLHSEKLRPYHHCLHMFLSLSSPHLGLTAHAGSGLFKAAAVWGLRKWLKQPVLDELTQADASSPNDTLLYQLSDSPYLSLFRTVSYTLFRSDHYHLTG